TDSFEYEATDDSSAADQATVTITVESDNIPPEVITPFPDDSVTVSSPSIQLVNLESVFRDPDGDSLSITASSGNPSVLSAEDQGQEISLIPSTTGTTTVTLTASDGPAETSTDFSITVTPSDDSEDPSSRALAVVNTAGSTTKTVFGDTDVTVNFSDVSGSGGVDVSRFDSAPDGTDGIDESNVSDYRLVIEAKESTDKAFKFGSSTEIRLPVSDFGGISDPTQVTVYKRPTPGRGTFSSVPTTVDESGTPGDSSDDILVAETSSFSEFALASNTEPLPVELTEFTARRDGKTVRLRWRTASETNNAGFEVQHKQPDAIGYTEAGFVESRAAGGTTSKPQEYRFEITDIVPGTHQFRLRQVDTDGTEHLSKAVSVTVRMEEALRLTPPAPNPVQSRVRLRVGAREGGEATVSLYNVLGQRVGTLYEGTLAPGKMHTIRVGTSVLSRLSSGTYFVRLKAADGMKTRRITLLR
ncbi:MAG: T9SS type A sorting domain-containing protein, partial [Salinibacter sp.]|uniref:T9SS type A sorting domain-containing protein n=1 Tax=Salinibacter sp. TaxID=2065818 RepID=UPI0035D5205C